jgi:HupE / UreJ protein
MRSASFAILALLAAAWTQPAAAHKASDAYLQLDGGNRPTTLRIDVALRDLDAALDLDSDGDGRLTWREVKLAWPLIESYVLARIDLSGCPLEPAGRALEKRVDGVYAAMTLSSACLPADPPLLRYGVMAEVDPTHRGLERIVWAQNEGTLQVLVPHSVSGVISLNTAVPTTPATSLQFVREGIRHIVTGFDHVLFLICLLFPAVMRRNGQEWQPVRNFKEALLPVIGIVTAFTAAHSITLVLAATQKIVISPAFIEPAIAVTIMFAALDNLWPIFRGKRMAVTFFFGLIHGFGFASVLAELNLPVRQFAWALFQFNLGIEVGQVLIVTLLTTLLFALRGFRAYSPVFIRGGSVIAIAIASLWLVERIANVALLPA